MEKTPFTLLCRKRKDDLSLQTSNREKKPSPDILKIKKIHGNDNNSCLYLQCKNMHCILVTKCAVINTRTQGNNFMLFAIIFFPITNVYEFNYSNYKVQLLDTYTYPFKTYHCSQT